MKEGLRKDFDAMALRTERRNMKTFRENGQHSASHIKTV
jgi:hypothetical protein